LIEKLLIRDKPMFLLAIIAGQNLNKVLKVSIKREDFRLVAGVIHKQSTQAVELNCAFIYSTNKNF
jgi:hypothetical protein